MLKLRLEQEGFCFWDRIIFFLYVITPNIFMEMSQEYIFMSWILSLAMKNSQPMWIFQTPQESWAV